MHQKINLKNTSKLTRSINMVLLGQTKNSNRLELLISPSNTMLKLLVIFFVIKLYAQIKNHHLQFILI